MSLRNIFAGERHDAHYSDYYRSLAYYYRTLAPHDFRFRDSKPQKVGVAKKKCIQILGLPILNAFFSWQHPRPQAVACPYRLRDFQSQMICDLDKILLLEVTLAPKGQDNFISARLGST